MSKNDSVMNYSPDALRALCRKFVDVKSDGAAEEARIELEVTLSSVHLPSSELITDLKKKREARILERIKTAGFTEYSKALFREYVITDDDIKAWDVRRDIEESLGKTGRYHSYVMNDLDKRRKRVVGWVERYLTTPDEKERENYGTTLACNLKKAGFDEGKISGLFSRIENEKVHLREGRLGKR